MLGDGDETSSRYELLNMVKKHSNLLEKTMVDEKDASDVEMDMRFWHDVFDLYFIRGKESGGRQDDDLVFFVRKLKSLLQGSHGYGSSNNTENTAPYFVRRWAPKLDNLIDETYVDVDWRRSFYLDLIAHTSFSLSVAICSHQILQNHQAGHNAPLSPIYKVVKTVYASPSRVNFQLDSTKEVETTPAYPNMCFAVDDFDSTFHAVVLTEKDHCYCVVLNAHDGAAFPHENDSSIRDNPPLSVDPTFAAQRDTKRYLNQFLHPTCAYCTNFPQSRFNALLHSLHCILLTLFSGFVSYQMVRDAYDAGRSRFGSLLSGGHSPGKTDRIYMKGPGGHGEVEVAVSRVIDQSQQDSGPFSPVLSKKGFGIGSIFRRAASVASDTAKHAYAAASASSSNFDEEIAPLKCSLISISLPWENIAYDLLFKGAPPVNM